MSSFDPARPTRSRAAGRCGWRWRSCCSGGPTLLLLDEPTNHLDLEARNWLEEYLVGVSARGDPRVARSLLPRCGRHAHHRPESARADRLSRQLHPLHRRARCAHGAAAQGEARAGRGSRAREDVHRSLPLSGDQGVAGAEPHQDAREGGADRGAARAQADSLHVSGVRQERPDGARTSTGRPQGVRRHRRLLRARTCSSSAAIALRWSGRTAPASRR